MTYLNKIYNGLCFIGDPHLWSKNISSRIDGDYKSICLNRLEQSILIAKNKNCLPIILGDLFHSSRESDIDLITKLIKILKLCPFPPIVLEGNHDKTQITSTDDTAIRLLHETNLIRLIDTNNIFIYVKCGDTNIGIGGSPYGTDLPSKVDMQGDFNIWLSHHNLNFGDTYPGVTEIKEILGINLLVNGHIHKTKEPKRVGNMCAFNPGNIMRLSRDCEDHIPSVWIWSPASKYNFKQHPLIYEKKVFSETDIHIPLFDSVDYNTDIKGFESQFLSEMIKLNKNKDKSNVSDDGVEIKNNIISLGKVLQTDSDIIDDLLSIADKVINI